MLRLVVYLAIDALRKVNEAVKSSDHVASHQWMTVSNEKGKDVGGIRAILIRDSIPKLSYD